MIEKQSSLDIMNKFHGALSDIETLNKNIQDIESKVSEKINIINTYNNYVSSLADNIGNKRLQTSTDRIIFNLEPQKIVGGNYDGYGKTIHAKFVSIPTNVFNFLTESGSIFKNNAAVEFFTEDGGKDYLASYSNILKHESDGTKEDVFKVFTSDTITLAVQVNIGNISGGTRFNMFEIAPYLPGSFNINEIRIFTLDQYYAQDLEFPAVTVSKKIENVGAMRYAFNQKYDFYRIEFDIKLKYKLDGYPFGIRHLYFYDADMDAQNDYLALEVDKKQYIESIGQDISLITQSGETETTAHAQGIEYYLFYINSVFQTPLNNPLARNIMKFYAKIPLHEPLVGIEFLDIEVR